VRVMTDIIKSNKKGEKSEKKSKEKNSRERK
jgi:hypothetical protein